MCPEDKTYRGKHVKTKNILVWSFPNVKTYQEMQLEVLLEYEQSMLSGCTSDTVLASTVFRIENEISDKKRHLECAKVVLIPIYIAIATNTLKLYDISTNKGAIIIIAVLAFAVAFCTMILSSSMSWISYYEKLLEFVKQSDLFKKDKNKQTN